LSAAAQGAQDNGQSGTGSEQKLMKMKTNHCHLLLSSDLPNGPSLLMKFLGQRYVQDASRP